LTSSFGVLKGLSPLLHVDLLMFNVEVWKSDRFSFLYAPKLWKFQNSMPRFGFPNTFCFWCSKVRHWTIEG
jgi:hypothetical protein